MFNYTGQWIINTATDEHSGTPKWLTQPASGADPAKFIVKRMGTFTTEDVVSIYKTPYTAPINGQVTITMKKGAYDLDGSGDGSYMIDLNVRLSGQNLDSRFANDFVLKEAPFNFVIKVTDSDTTATMATKFADQINRMAREFGDMRLTATAAGNDVTITSGEVGLQKFFLFEKVTLSQFDEKSPNPVLRQFHDLEATTNITKPSQGFGDYDWIIRNYILPTTEHRNIWTVHELDQPIVGGHYNAYNITICNRVGVQGLAHVGDIVDAQTSHVFYVLDSLATEWEAALATVGTIQTV